jgi:hypothetical protein
MATLFTNDTSSSQPPSFRTLPAELRYKIWLYTFEPRTLCVYIHPLITRSSESFSWQTTSCTFTAELGLPPHPRRKMVHLSRTNRVFVHEHARLKPPPGPIAMQVCRDSRDFALSRYSLAFAGCNRTPGNEDFSQVFEDHELGIGKIWVDFRHDTVFIPNTDDVAYTQLHEPWPLEFYLEFARADVRRIEKLAVMGHWRQKVPNPGWFGDDGGLRECLIRKLKFFTALKELKVYFTYMDTSLEGDERQKVMDAGIVRKWIIDDLVAAKADCEDWTADLPMVTVSTALQWFRVRRGVRELQHVNEAEAEMLVFMSGIH